MKKQIKLIVFLSSLLLVSSLNIKYFGKFKITTPHEFELNNDDLKGIRSVLLNEQFINPNNTLYKIEFSIKILE